MKIRLFFEFGESPLWYKRKKDVCESNGLPKKWKKDKVLVVLDDAINDMWTSFFENRPDAFYFCGPRSPYRQKVLKKLVKVYVKRVKSHMGKNDVITENDLLETLKKPLENDHPEWDLKPLRK